MLISITLCIILEILDILSQWSHIWFWLRISWNSSEKLHFGNVANMPYLWPVIVFPILLSTQMHLHNILSHWERRHNIRAKCDLLLHASKMQKHLLTAEFMYWITVWFINNTDRLSEQCLVDSLRQQPCLLHISADAFYVVNRTVWVWGLWSNILILWE